MWVDNDMIDEEECDKFISEKERVSSSATTKKEKLNEKDPRKT